MGTTPVLPRKRVSHIRRLLKIFVLFLFLALSLSAVVILFQWKAVEQLPELLWPYAPILLIMSPYLRYFNALIILILGYFIVGEVGRILYDYMRGFSDHSSALTIQNITRIVGFGVILAVLASVFSLDPSAAITLGGFGGLVVGFATQTFLSNTIAGIFILMTRPFTFGDVITIAGNTGVVKEIKLMHIHLDTLEGAKDILVPNSMVLSQVILKNMPGERMGPIPTMITLDQPLERVKIGTEIVFTGHLMESVSRKPLAGADVQLYDKDIISNDLLAEGQTDAEGNYSIQWVSRKVDPFDETAEIFAKFEGDDDHKSSHSHQFLLTVKN